ncbi:lysine transporter LysE [Shewanella sp. Choline-02u-19]|jgi:threonine/homoserine/homoserine lactone efflux protein|uniref:LysE family translocator n=1 Tax=Shewanella TaxID=22 RepID=UPI000C329F8E|nr:MULTISPECIES: LysE family translocator [Shewanella]MCL1058513.1 LysE family translocator [Shewanella gelidimarina]PKG57868.1 lysine transporter LysE [Shewanella sp. GutDb-MelDb]PKG76043.1 lysine transporter LysE [Shewanella sp. GutCb]PKH56676.1 lysine transporter LysE [Shewanella sp. Bg11-22]PKI30227.1 lysine transporter LysE [Shewanella sp. Choline-02u-19]
MSFSAWLGLLAICCLGAMSPGPSLAMVVRHTLGGGRTKGIICAWAHSIGIGVYALVTLLGLAVVLKKAPMVFNAIAIIGALYLAYMGVQALRSKGGMSDKLAAGKSTDALTAARDGLAISLFNPKIMLFFLALFSQFVMVADNMTAKGLIVLTPLIVDGLWYTLIALVLSHSAVLPKLREKAALIDKLSGVVLILLAIRVLASL